MTDSNKRNNKSRFTIGGIVLVLIYLPVIMLNANMKAVIHDEFDGELLTYILQAKHLADNCLPELFNGALKSAMTPPAPGFVVLFLLFSVPVSFFLMHIIIAVTAYIGMFLVIDKITEEPWIAAVTAVLFAALPFYTVYGLSAMGQPLLLYAFMLLWENKKPVVAFLIILFFGINSSLFLIGYADGLLIILGLLIKLIKKDKTNEKLASAKKMFIGGAELGCIYLLFNKELIVSIFSKSEGFTTHKSEIVVQSIRAMDNLIDSLFHGAYHVESRHFYILIYSLIVLLVGAALSKRLKTEERNKLFLLGKLWILVLLITCFKAFCAWKPFVDFRNHIGGALCYFQFDRFYWLYPALWFLLLGVSFYLTCRIITKKAVCIAVLTCIILVDFGYILQGGSIQANLRTLLNKEQSGTYASVEEFYQPALFERAEAIIGEPQDEYRVCSIGLFPSIALYNGFYCLDGYSNNYSLDYKHEFRKIISEELEKDEELKKYYDDWGNRCYLFSSELGNSYFIPKNSGKQINNLSIGIRQFQAMGGKYIFSSVPINNESLLLKEKMSSETSFYDVYIYQVKDVTDS